MIELTESIIDDFNKAKPWAFATSSLTGEPNVCMVGMAKLVDPGIIWIVDNFMKKTYSNILENPRGSLMVHSSETKGSYQIKGDLEIMNHGDDYEAAKKWAQDKNPKLPAKNLVVFRITDVYNVKSGPDAGNRINMI
ncbi:MAG: pyridoxamine 5'-phosphate oxidase family protein [Candidatus Methanomethylophilaceae archaeon]|nr:pyridoxamine 5'-phosphate oxidase family protein [Candidatus Methanomethylophilaceae archaeon]